MLVPFPFLVLNNLYWDAPPLSDENAVSSGYPTKNSIILVAADTGWGEHSKDLYRLVHFVNNKLLVPLFLH